MRSTPREIRRTSLNFRWLLNLRWAAAIGQLVTILGVWLVLGIQLPVVTLLAIVAFELVSNIVFVLWHRSMMRSGTWDEWAERWDLLLMLILILDLLVLTGLFYACGGPSNPFSVFYLVHVVLGAELLVPSRGWILAGLALACYSLLFVDYLPVAALEPDLVTATKAQLVEARDLERSGLLVALATAAAIILYFFQRMTTELRELTEELVLAQRQRADSERLEALATLAAGAAHELSSPLSTIAVVAKELEITLAKRSDLGDSGEDARLIRSQVGRCRAILDRMAADAGESAGELLQRHRVAALIDATLDGLDQRSRFDVHIAGDAGEREVVIPLSGLAQALRGVCVNALDASPPEATIEVHVAADDGRLDLRITDRGTGMDAEVLAKAGDPFFTTKETGKGMGLGLFLARTVVERLGGGMELHSTLGAGTEVRVELPLASASDASKDRNNGWLGSPRTGR